MATIRRTIKILALCIGLLAGLSTPSMAANFLFTVSVSQVLSAIDATPDFGGGTCGATPSSYSVACGIYDLQFTPYNLPDATVEITQSNFPASGNGAWESWIWSDTNPVLPGSNSSATLNGVEWYGAFADQSNQQYVSFITSNQHTVGVDYSSTLLYAGSGLTGAAPLSAGTYFTISVETTAAVKASDVTWRVDYAAVGLDPVTGAVGDKAVTGYFEYPLPTPEPSTAVFCLAGVALILGLRRKRA